jgi:hypothetical protein
VEREGVDLDCLDPTYDSNASSMIGVRLLAEM